MVAQGPLRALRAIARTLTQPLVLLVVVVLLLVPLVVLLVLVQR
jgi:hypothetical protein